MNRSPAHGLAFEMLFAFGLAVIAELVVLSTHWSTFWVLVVVFTTGNVLRWWLEARRRSSTPNAEQGTATEPPT